MSTKSSVGCSTAVGGAFGCEKHGWEVVSFLLLVSRIGYDVFRWSEDVPAGWSSDRAASGRPQGASEERAAAAASATTGEGAGGLARGGGRASSGAGERRR